MHTPTHMPMASHLHTYNTHLHNIENVTLPTLRARTHTHTHTHTHLHRSATPGTLSRPETTLNTLPSTPPTPTPIAAGRGEGKLAEANADAAGKRDRKGRVATSGRVFGEQVLQKGAVRGHAESGRRHGGGNGRRSGAGGARGQHAEYFYRRTQERVQVVMRSCCCVHCFLLQYTEQCTPAVCTPMALYSESNEGEKAATTSLQIKGFLKEEQHTTIFTPPQTAKNSVQSRCKRCHEEHNTHTSDPLNENDSIAARRRGNLYCGGGVMEWGGVT